MDSVKLVWTGVLTLSIVAGIVSSRIEDTPLRLASLAFGLLAFYVLAYFVTQWLFPYQPGSGGGAPMTIVPFKIFWLLSLFVSFVVSGLYALFRQETQSESED